MKNDDNKIYWFDQGTIDDNGFDLKKINEDNTEENVFAQTECTDLQSGQKQVNNHYWFVPRIRNSESQAKNRPSVLILVIESLSRLNYLRHMQLTKDAFESLGNVFYLRGLNKMADNSFPNMIPMLTGK